MIEKLFLYSQRHLLGSPSRYVCRCRYLEGTRKTMQSSTIDHVDLFKVTKPVPLWI